MRESQQGNRYFSSSVFTSECSPGSQLSSAARIRKFKCSVSQKGLGHIGSRFGTICNAGILCSMLWLSLDGIIMFCGML